MNDFIKKSGYVNKTKFKDDWQFIDYVKFCIRHYDKIKEIELDRLGKSYECCISKFKSKISFEAYVEIWKKKGYKIV